MQPARNHEMKDTPYFVIESKDNTFSEIPNRNDFMVVNFEGEWFHASEKERMMDRYLDEFFSQYSFFQRGYVYQYIRKFRHCI
jgi:hypothetical protein